MSLKEYRGFGAPAERIEKAILGGNFSHACIIEGDNSLDKEAFAKSIIKAIICKIRPGDGCDSCAPCRKVDHGNYEDLYHIKGDGLSLKDAQVAGLQEKLRTKPVAGDRNFAVIEDADSMTPRAQNRLLKTLEEPPGKTVIFLLSENTENLLTTVVSRCVVYRLAAFTDTCSEGRIREAEDIVRMALDSACFADIKDSLSKCVKDRKEAFVFLDSLERLFHMYMTGEKPSPFTGESIICNVGLIEEARRGLLANVNYKYAVRELILKLEDR